MSSAWHRFLAPLTPGVCVLLFLLALSYSQRIQSRILRARASRTFVSERIGGLEL